MDKIILTFEETRIIGSLIEKELTTPEYYPLTINSLKNACNQKSNRNPVVAFDEDLLEKTVEGLRSKSLISRVTGGEIRVPKYRQVFTEALNLSAEETAAICVLMLRGPQTPGEIKGRTGRMFTFENLVQVDEVLQNLMNRETPLAVKLPRQTGMKEARYAHLLSGQPDEEIPQPVNEEESSLSEERMEKIESLIEGLREELNGLKKEFEEFKNQFK